MAPVTARLGIVMVAEAAVVVKLPVPVTVTVPLVLMLPVVAVAVRLRPTVEVLRVTPTVLVREASAVAPLV